MVYFRNYAKDLDGETALFGEFLNIPKKMENAQICSYDIDTKEVVSEFDDFGFGELYLYKDTFYLKEIEGKEDTDYGNIYSIKTDGSDRKDITKGHILAMNPGGQQAAAAAPGTQERREPRKTPGLHQVQL